MTMTAADFMFPVDLRVTDSNISDVLILGSCAATYYHLKLRKLLPNVKFDFLMANNYDILPDAPPSPVGGYDFQFIQISLRDLLTDRVVRFNNFRDLGHRSSIIDAAFRSLEMRLEACLKYNVKHRLLTFVSNFPVPQRAAAAALNHVGTEFDLSSLIRKLNERLAELVSQYRNAYIADYDALCSSMGKRFFHDDILNFYSHFGQWFPEERDYDMAAHHNAPSGGRLDPLPHVDEVYESRVDEMIEALWRQWESMYRTANQIDAVKLVIFDLDDTLWRGQIAEHYGDEGGWPVFYGWPAGIWEAVHHLRARGIMTAICSKNEESLVRLRWDRATHDSLILPDDFIFVEINWRPKAESIAKIIKQASLTPKSVLFIDDNPVERESVRLALPGIRVLGSNPYVVRRVLLWSSETQVATITSESANREDMTRKQVLREVDRESLSREDFLKQLGCIVKVRTIEAERSQFFPRSLELLNKTNQFNTTGERRTFAEIAAFFAEGGKLFAFDVEDKYTEYGLVGVILFREGEFSQFVMSCRVLGLEVETSVISAIMQAEVDRVSGFSARVVHTEANMVCRDVFARCGFVADTQEGTRFEMSRSAIGDIAPHLALTMERSDTMAVA